MVMKDGFQDAGTFIQVLIATLLSDLILKNCWQLSLLFLILFFFFHLRKKCSLVFFLEIHCVLLVLIL